MDPQVSRNLWRAFHPRAVAVVGDKQATGYMWLKALKGFRGPLYSVQVDPRELPGIEALQVSNYTQLQEVPEAIDYVMAAVPRAVAPRIMADCIEKDVGGVSFFTGGFAESGEEEGIRLQEALAEMARSSKVALIGPNCVGIYNPRLGLRQSPEQTADGGPVGFISQSGTHCTRFTLAGPVHGVGISKAVSFGNGAALEAADYLEFLAQDPETRVIAMYVEGVRDGRRFFRLLRETTPQKPVVIWKGGQTEAGGRAAASHTAALAMAPPVWQAAIAQAGAIGADSLEEAIDITKALLYLKPSSGPRVALLAMTGGQSVAIGDAFAAAGLSVPPFSDASYARLAAFFITLGGSYRNPIDAAGTVMGGWGGDPQNLHHILEVLGDDESTDALVLELNLMLNGRRWQREPEILQKILDDLAAFREDCPKPFLIVAQPVQHEELATQVREQAARRGIPAFAGFHQAARALRKVVDYYRFRSEVGP